MESDKLSDIFMRAQVVSPLGGRGVWIRGFHNLLKEKTSFKFVLLGCTLISSASFISWPTCLNFLTMILVLVQLHMMVFLGLSEVTGLSKKICIKR